MGRGAGKGQNWKGSAEGWSKGGSGKHGKRDGDKGKGKGRGSGGVGGAKPTDDPQFVQLSTGAILRGSASGTEYVVDAYVASGSFSRVFKVRRVARNDGSPCEATVQAKKRWGPDASARGGSTAKSDIDEDKVFAAKVMRKHDSYIQYTSDACKEADLLQRLEKSQRDDSKDVITMQCFDSFPVQDDAGVDYWCLILEWLDASLFDVVKANGNRGLHLSMVRIILTQLIEQLRVLQAHECTHTDIKHKNCCLADTSHFFTGRDNGQRPSLILTNPLAKFIDYGNAVFEGEKKIHPIHTKQFRAPEVLLNITQGWGPASDTWTLGITAAYLISGQLLFNSHDPQELINIMVETLGPFPSRLLDSAKDSRIRRSAEQAASRCGRTPILPARLGLDGCKTDSPEAQCVDLIQQMLALDPTDRISAVDALAHPFLVGGLPRVPACPEDTRPSRIGDGR